jgi:hypothetical protein
MHRLGCLALALFFSSGYAAASLEEGSTHPIRGTPTHHDSLYSRCMPRTAESLVRENIFDIFSEHDPEKRRAKIASLWADDGVFIVVNPPGRYEGHSGVEEAAAGFIAQFPTFTFTLRGEAQAYSGVGMIPWAFGPPGREPIITGIDVLVIKGDKIGAVYVFQDSQPKK